MSNHEGTSPATGNTEPAASIPDYLASPNAVFADVHAKWRYGKPPDYTKTRKVWAEGKNTTPTFLPSMNR